MIALVAVVSALSLAGAGGETTYSQPAHLSAPLSAGGELEVDNTNGDVAIVRGGAGIVDIDAVKRAYAQDDLTGINVHVDAVGGAVKISTDYPSAWRGLHRVQRWVDYKIQVPIGTKVIVRLKYGDARVEGVAGPVDAQSKYGNVNVAGAHGEQSLATEYGDVSLAITAIDAAASISMRTTYGDVDLAMPAASAPNIAAVTRFGSLNNDFDANGRGPRVDVRTTFGDVNIRKETKL
jgi:hypothetical protein